MPGSVCSASLEADCRGVHGPARPIVECSRFSPSLFMGPVPQLASLQVTELAPAVSAPHTFAAAKRATDSAIIEAGRKPSGVCCCRGFRYTSWALLLVDSLLRIALRHCSKSSDRPSHRLLPAMMRPTQQSIRLVRKA
jgi:hypothetical protein